MGLYLIGALAAILVAAAVAFAAVPQTINYQGYLTDSGGSPVNGTVNMTFSLYTSPAGTVSPVWTEAQTGVAVTNGQYSVILGSITPLAIPFDVPYYLGVTVGADAEMTPRQPLTSTGYAFRAAQADGLSSTSTLTVTNAIVSTVPTGVAPLQVTSTTVVPNLNVEMVGGMHATDFVAKAGDTMTGSLTVPSATLTGILTLPTTTVNTGIIMQNTDTLIHTYGSGNFFAGTNAGNLTMTGNNNTAIGYAALSSNTLGRDNTAIGYEALHSNSSSVGYRNTAVGSNALFSHRGGDSNTAVGFAALYSDTGSEENTAVGNNALYYNTGEHNTAVGHSALLSNTTGTQNTAIGRGALSATTGYRNTAIGAGAGNGDIDNINGNLNTFLGSFTGVSLSGLTNATAVGYGAIVDASNHVRIGNTDVTQIGGQVAWSNLSDVREKKDINDIGYGLNFIKQLRPVQFRMKNGNDRIDYGFIAQDIEALLGTNYNVLGIGGDPDRMLSLRYTDFIAPMVKAMQEQQAQIDAQKAMIEELKAEIAALKQRLP
jgi:hypothetical protein